MFSLHVNKYLAYITIQTNVSNEAHYKKENKTRNISSTILQNVAVTVSGEHSSIVLGKFQVHILTWRPVILRTIRDFLQPLRDINLNQATTFCVISLIAQSHHVTNR